MDRTKLLSIGIFSKLTGVHIKSLRYYDEIGILAPAYVDPDTRYRYYSFSQIHVVDAIQLCIELDIPLKQFPEYIDPEQKQCALCPPARKRHRACTGKDPEHTGTA